MAADHAHDHARDAGRDRLGLVLGLVVLYMGAEVVGGLLTGSLALLADAGHMLSDAASLALALVALRVARRPPDARRTFGWYRAEVLAAVVNAATLLAISAYVFVEAFRRLAAPADVHGAPMMAIAVGGLLVNLAGLRILGSGRRENLNVRGAWLHVLADALGSVGAIVAGALVWAFGWDWADPAASLLIGVLVLVSGGRLLRETTGVLMGEAPEGIDVDALRRAIGTVPGVRDVHDLHVWTLTSGLPILSVHVVVDEDRYDGATLAAVRRRIHDACGVEHVTVQLETPALVEPETPV